MIYDLWIINQNRWFNDLKSVKSNQPKFVLRFRFIIQLSRDLAEHWLQLTGISKKIVWPFINDAKKIVLSTKCALEKWQHCFWRKVRRTFVCRSAASICYGPKRDIFSFLTQQSSGEELPNVHTLSVRYP